MQTKKKGSKKTRARRGKERLKGSEGAVTGTAGGSAKLQKGWGERIRHILQNEKQRRRNTRSRS